MAKVQPGLYPLTSQAVDRDIDKDITNIEREEYIMSQLFQVHPLSLSLLITSRFITSYIISITQLSSCLAFFSFIFDYYSPH